MSNSTESSSPVSRYPNGTFGTLDLQPYAPHHCIRQISYVTVDEFIRCALPRSYEVTFPKLDIVIDQLKIQSIIDGRGYWRDFPVNPSSYSPLANVISRIFDVAKTVATSDYGTPDLLEYLNNDKMTRLEASERQSTFLPDGFFVLKDRPHLIALSWSSIAVITKFKQADYGVAVMNTVDKLLRGFNHILGEDPCRVSVLGFTMEKTSMKMWYADRSNVVASDDFDIHKDSRVFVAFCLSMLYADRDELGWDATIQRVGLVRSTQTPVTEVRDSGAEKQTKKADDENLAAKVPSNATNMEMPRGQRDLKATGGTKGSESQTNATARYVIDVRVDAKTIRRFITISVISIRGADGILGRGTRVWEARELLEGDRESEETVAIKDYWIDSDRRREGEVFESIMADAPDDTHRALLRNHLVEVVCHGDVYRRQVSVGRSPEGEPILNLVSEPNSTRDLKQVISHRVKGYDIATGTSHVNSGIPMQRLHRPRTRNRIVMKQVGTTLHGAKSLRTVFDALLHVCKGLSLIHQCGWMHRDISTGNILLYDGKALLLDFEYAKRTPKKEDYQSQIRAPAERTGTPYFMSVEVQAGRYLFRPQGAGYELEISSDSDAPPPSFSRRAPATDSAPVHSQLRKRKTARGPRTSGASATGAEPEGYLGQSTEPLATDPPSKGSDSDVPIASNRVAFTYNPLHEFEALIWVGMYFIFNKTVSGHGQRQSQQEMEAQRAYARSLFSEQAEPRRVALTTVHKTEITEIDEVIKILHPSVRRIGRRMKKMMGTMKALYLKLEAGDPSIMASPHHARRCKKLILPILQEIVVIFKHGDIEVEPLARITLAPAQAVATDNANTSSKSCVDSLTRPTLKTKTT